MAIDPKEWAPGFSVSLSIDDMPEVLAELRRQLATIVRTYADQMPGPASREDLHRLADAFEAGQSPEDPE